MCTITINEHSSIRVESAEGVVVYFDPFRVAGAPADANAVLITHSHYDHYDPESLAAVCRPGTVVVAPCALADELRGQGDAARAVVGMEPGDAAEVCGLSVQAVPAYNMGKKFHPRANQWLGYVLSVDGERIYVCGDTDATPEAHAVACDTICVPVGGTYTMDAEEAAALVNALSPLPAKAVPTHYGTVVGTREDGPRFAALVDPRIAVELLLRF